MDLEKTLLLSSHGYSTRDIDRFINITKNYTIHWFEYDGKVWIPSREVSLAKGNHATVYSSSWWKTGKGDCLRGDHLYLTGEELVIVRSLLKSRYPELNKMAGYRQQLFLEWIKAVDFFHYEEDSNTTPEEEAAILGDNLIIDSRFLSKRLGITHSYLKRLIKRYEVEFNRLGPLIKKEEVPSGELYYVLLESQCYFLTSVLSNKPEVVEFKIWMINHIQSIKQLKGASSGEKLIQDRLIQLSSYCSVKVRSEVTLTDTFSTKSSSSRRVDLLIQDSIAVELKKDKINTNIVTEVLADKSYFDLLEQTFPSFKVLVISGPEGITDDAKRLLALMKPKVTFMSVKQVGSFLAEFILRETPKSGHWWLYNFVFPQFKDILLNQYLQPSISDTKLLIGS